MFAIGTNIVTGTAEVEVRDPFMQVLICEYFQCWQCMSSAIVLNKDNRQSKAFMLASIAMLPFQPLLVTAIHTSIVEVCLHLLELQCVKPCLEFTPFCSTSMDYFDNLAVHMVSIRFPCSWFEAHANS